MADGHEANHSGSAVDGIDDPKASDTILPQPVEFTLKRLPTFRVIRNSTNRSFDGTFQVRVERTNYLGDMRRDVGPKEPHAVRRFFAGVNGSPNTSSKERPFLRVR